MISFNNHEINSIYYEKHQIQQAYWGNKLIFDLNNYESNKIYNTSTVSSMLTIDAKIGDKIITNGYYSNNDNGAAKYEVVSYSEWYSSLPADIKFIYKNNKFISTPVDEYGNHTLKNGLIAKLVTKSSNGIYNTTPEQWGAKGDGLSNDIWPFIHMFAQTKTGNITFKNSATYIMGLTGDSLLNCKDNPYRMWMCGGLLGSQYFFKPIMADIDNVNFIGNNSLITIPDGQWGTSGMGIWNFSGNINNLNISGFRFDGKSYSIFSDQKNTNHTLFYAPGTFYTNVLGSLSESHPRYDKNTGSFNKVSLKNWNINNNEFKNSGSMYKKAGDYGGDFILIVNPDAMDGLFIEDNKFLYWGRWVLSIDLGGNGERLYNIKFNRNYCRGDNSSEAPQISGWNWHGLGLIDFESKKCFTNIEMIDNDIEGQGGFAINGNSKISENILIKNNRWIHTGGGYPYMLSCYSGYLKNITFENNYLDGNGSGNKLGIAAKNVYIKNNTVKTSFRIDNIYGNIIFDNNISQSSYSQLLYINNGAEVIETPFKTEESCNLSFKNNVGGINALNMLYLPNIKNLEIYIDNNKSDFLQLNAFGCKKFNFTPNEMFDSKPNFTVRGATFTSATYSFSQTPIVGGAIYNTGDICTNNLYDTITLLSNSYYYNLFDSLNDCGNNLQKWFGKNNIKKAGLKCIKSGYLPTKGGWGFRYEDTQFASNLKVQANAYIFTEDSLYLACNDGNLGDTPPSHKSGSETNGTVKLLYICELGKIEIFKIL